MNARKQQKVLPVHAACLTGNKAALKRIISTVSRRALEVKDCLGRTPLILAVSCNFIDCGAVLLKAGVTVDNTDNAGQTALHIAACKGFHQFVRLLLSYKASCIQRDFYGATALHMAAMHPNVKGLTIIVRHIKPAEIDIQDSSLKTALHWSAAYACNDSIKVLLAQGANACIPDKDGKTPLHWAVANSSPEALDCVKTLLKKESSLINWQDYQGRSPLHVAVAASGSEEILYFLASKENCIADVLDNSFCTPLHYAAKRGFSEKADILLKKRASHLSIDDNGATPLHYAAHNNHAETVEVFISKSYINDEPDKFRRTALMWAAIKNAEAALKVLASNVMTLLHADRSGVTALHAAAIYGHASAVELLVKAGLYVDMKDNYGMTPFLKACQFGRSKAAQMLLSLGANINATDTDFCSALHWCARGGHAYLTDILIKRGADYNVLDSYRRTPLHYASATGDFINCTCVLIESGADPNLIDTEGMTPLHYAVLNQRIGIARYLCEHGSDVNAMYLLENDWVTPYDCAFVNFNVNVAVLLQQYGGIRAQDIKECAAEVIQTWYRKLKRIRHSKSIKSYDLHATERSCDSTYVPRNDNCFYIPNFPKSNFTYKKGQDLFHICNGCFHEVICGHICKKDNLSIDELDISERNMCVPVSELPGSFLNSEKGDVFSHKGGGYFHKAFSYGMCAEDHQNKNMSTAYCIRTKDEAARVIQRAWKKYMMKKSFAKVRQEVVSSYNDHERLEEEYIYQNKIKDFYMQFYE